MSEVIKIKKGFDIKLQGEASQVLGDIQASQVALKPSDFKGLLLKPAVQEGAMVQVGSSILFDKNNPDIVITSPVSGVVKTILRGEKRLLQAIIIDNDGRYERLDFGKADPSGMSRGDVVAKILKSGLWPFIIQRPYAVVANPAETPDAIFVSCFDSSPLAPDLGFVIKPCRNDFETGIKAIAKLTSGKVVLGLREGDPGNDVFEGLKDVAIFRFKGPHPAGNVGIQIHHVHPVNKGSLIWTLNPQGVALIGRLFRNGYYDALRIIALTGSEVTNPSYVQVVTGAFMGDILAKHPLKSKNSRVIGGNVLTGDNIGASGYIGFYNNQVTAIPEGNHHQFLGWADPGFNRLSFFRTFFSWLTPQKKYALNTNMNGGHRAFVITGAYERVLPMDIYPMQLLKAILAEDIEKMEHLGIYEVAEEDFALAEFIDPSKNDIQAIVRQGLDLVRKELSE